MKGIKKFASGCFGFQMLHEFAISTGNGGLGSLTACPQLRLCPPRLRRPRCQGPGRGSDAPATRKTTSDAGGQGPVKSRRLCGPSSRQTRHKRQQFYMARVARTCVRFEFRGGHHEHLWLIRFSRTSMAFGDAVPAPLGFVALRQKHGIGEGDEPHRQRRQVLDRGPPANAGSRRRAGCWPQQSGTCDKISAGADARREDRKQVVSFSWNTDRLCSAPGVSGPKREIPGVTGTASRRPVVAPISVRKSRISLVFGRFWPGGRVFMTGGCAIETMQMVAIMAKPLNKRLRRSR